ncbi:MAG: hypothetical protein DWP97_12505 [Calditrichaeota bacterium]|nr:MAG: hypothetical protein DWP97_12505 [Calditrichota bacterium]
MFDFLRRMIVPIMMIALVGFLATIIFEWGMGIGSQQQYEEANLAAVINGEEVEWNDFNRVYESLYQVEIQKDTNDIPADITEAKRNELYQNAWNQILMDRLMKQEIAKHNITVSDDELYQYLKFSPLPEFQSAAVFQTNGRFDYQKYINSLADPNYASLWASYDPYIRQEIKKLKLQEMVIQTAHVSENEVKEFFIASAEKVKVGMINVEYGRFSRPAPTITDSMIHAHYNANSEDYTLGARAKLNIIMIEKKPSPADWEAGKAQIQTVLDSLNGGADFGEMAKIYSQDNSAAQGGDLGWFPRGQMVDEFDRQVFAMKEGEISPPIRTQFGWHLIQNNGFKEEMEVPRGKQEKEKVLKVNAAHILIKVEASANTLDLNYNRLQTFHEQALENGFLKAAEDLNMQVKQTDYFMRGRNIQFLGSDPQAGLFAFENEIDKISPIFESSSAQYVVQVADKLPEGPAPFEDAKERVRIDLLQLVVKNICNDTAQVIWDEIQSGASLTKAAKNHGEEYEEPAEFGRGQYVKGINRDPNAIGAAFALQNVGDLSGPVDHGQGTVILKLISKTSPDLTQFTAKKDSIQTQILLSKQQELFGRWLENLRENATIVNNVFEAAAANRL